MPQAGSSYRKNETCITCHHTKPCSYHGIRRGFVCADCWIWAEVPDDVKRNVGFRNQRRIQERDKKDCSRPVDAPPPHRYLTVQRTKHAANRPIPTHPDAL